MANDISTSFNDRQMFVTQPNWGSDITSNIDVQRRILQNMGGVKIISEINTDTPITASGDFTLSDRESIYNLLEFFNARKGGTESFWFLHPARFFILKENYSSGNGYIEVERNYGDLWTQALPSQYDWGIYIYMHNGDLICRKVTGVTDEIDRSYVYLDETIPRNITADNHFIIGRTLASRFDQNQLSIDFSSQGIGITPLRLKENYREYDEWASIEGKRQWQSVRCGNQTQDYHYGRVQIQDGSNGEIASSGDHVNIGSDGVYFYYPWIKFDNIKVPVGSTITRCDLVIWTQHVHSSKNATHQMRFGAVDNAYQIGTYSQLYNYPKTSAYSNWLWYSTDVWPQYSYHETTDITAALDEVISRPGWAEGNSVIWFSRVVQSGTTYRSFYRSSIPSYQKYRPLLRIEWV